MSPPRPDGTEIAITGMAAHLLETGNARRVFNHTVRVPNRAVAFMFPGGGAQYVGMARDLYETEPVFADGMDRGPRYPLAAAR